MQMRGRVVPVIDLRARFGLAAAAAARSTRGWWWCRAGARAVGLLVDSAREVLKIDPGGVPARRPRWSPTRRQGFVKAVAQAGERLVMLIDLDKVIGEERIDGE